MLIKGNVIDFETKEPMECVSVFIDSLSGISTDSNGFFEFYVSEIKANDVLKIRFIGYYELNFKNLPNSDDTLHLKNIPLFEFSCGISMVEFFCRKYNLICNWKRKKHNKKEKKRIDEYYSERRKIINAYVFQHNGERFIVDFEKNVIDLNDNR
jgi:hypothetical protein